MSSVTSYTVRSSSAIVIRRNVSTETVYAGEEDSANSGVFPSLLNDPVPSSSSSGSYTQGGYKRVHAISDVLQEPDSSVLGIFLKQHYIGCMTQSEATNTVRMNESAQSNFLSIYHQLPKSVEEMRAETARDDYSSLRTDELPLHVLYRGSRGEVYQVGVHSMDIKDEEITIAFNGGPTMSEDDQDR